MHTWVEAYFPGVGWYPFNPTWILHAGRDGGQRPAARARPAGYRPPENSCTGASSRKNRRSSSPGSATRTRRIKVPPRAPGRTLFRSASVRSRSPRSCGGRTSASKRVLLPRQPEDLYRDLTGRLRDVLPPNRSIVADSPALTPTERVLLLAGAAGIDEAPMRRFALAYSDHSTPRTVVGIM